MGQLGDLSPLGSIAVSLRQIAISRQTLMKEPKQVGVIVGLLSTSVQSLGLTLQRKSHILEDEKGLYDVRRPPHRRRRWQVRDSSLYYLCEDMANSIPAWHAYVRRLKPVWKHDPDHDPSSASAIDTASGMSSAALSSYGAAEQLTHLSLGWSSTPSAPASYSENPSPAGPLEGLYLFAQERCSLPYLGRSGSLHITLISSLHYLKGANSSCG